MEIRATLNKPYTEDQRINFIVEQNHQLGYEIKETETELQAWGFDDAEKLQQAKKAKYNKANEGAKKYLEGDALYEFIEGKHIEATDGNIAKLTAYALAFVTGQLQPTDTVVWNTKEDETVELSQEQIVTIINGLGAVQALVWSIQFPSYVQAIEQAKTIEEVNAIEIIYTSEIPPEEETDDNSNE